ncbi:alkaline shock response membrane anchor protein AmaP [Microtetraspora sp. NBRC 16547]|uniref:alkaline shock response membrane anchor protein AmaP n=1 Tax=Microtetraspora sp. NBRC 16547 TaxID=3030993 RepID=UPI0024A5044F|nr:alkaline shock response membrane anchor protein AmaP [Microtetraspora sp. NBRC 16547]GLW98679.1 hypothetical protein Misp02_27660 [Microtetraspora sp. NBRC 16547]
MRRGKAFGRGIAWCNRLGLTLLGLILFAAGGAALARGLGVFGASAARQPLLAGPVASFARTTAWFWPAVAAAGVVVAVIGLVWLVALLRADRLRRMRLESGPTGVTEIDAREAGAALATRVSAYGDVQRARAALRGTNDAPALDLRVTSRDPHPDALLARLHDEAVPDLRSALGLERLPALVRVDFVTGRRIREVR